MGEKSKQRLAAAFGALIACWPMHSYGQDAGFSADEIYIKIPQSIRGYVDDPQQPLEEFEGIYRIRGWIQGKAQPPLSADDPVGSGASSSPQGPFDMLRSLLKAYQDQNLDAVLKLYNADSRSTILNMIEDPARKEAWLESIGKVVAVEPLIAWELNDRQTYFLLRAEYLDRESGKSATGQLGVIFNERFELVVGEVKSVMRSNLALYFADRSRKAEGLILNLQYFLGRMR